MIKFYDPSGESHFGQATVTRTTSVNGGLSLTGEVFAGDDVLTGLDYGWWLNFDNENYVITYKKLSDDTNTIVFDAVQKFFWDFAKVALHSEYTGSHTYEFYLNQLFNGSGYTYQNDATVPAFEKENWGYKNKLSLFNDIMDQADVEFEVHNETVHIAKQIGSDLTSFVRKGINLSDLTEEMKISDFATYAKGYGAFNNSEDPSQGRLEVEYRSELADRFGDLEMDPIVDERYTVADNLIAALKNQVDATYTVSMTMNIYDLENAGYPNYESPKVGDWILAIDEALSFKRKIRIIELEEQFDVTGKRIGYTATCGDLSIIDQYTNIQSSLDSRVQRIQRSVDDVAISADGKNSNYYGAKEPASADDGDLWYKKNGDDTELYVWANGRWEIVVSKNTSNIIDQKVDSKLVQLNDDMSTANSNIQAAKQDISDLQVNLKANDDTQAQLTKDLAANSNLITQNKEDVDATLDTVNNNLSKAKADVATAVDNANTAVAKADKAIGDAGFAKDTANQATKDAAAAQDDAANALLQASQSVDDAKIAVADATTAKGQAANALGQANTAINNAANALDKFNNMSVGGRNYFLNSDFSQDETNWNDPNGVWFMSDEKCNGQKVMTATPTVSWTGGPTNSFNQTMSAITNQQVTVSVWAKASKSGAKFHSEPNGGYGAFDTLLTNTWKRYSYVAQTNTVGTIHFMAVDVGTQYWISMPQVEIGNKVTDWSSAPEDVQQQFTNIDGELASKVSQTTYNTLAGTVDTVNTLAKQNQSTIGTLATSASVDTVSGRVTKVQSLAEQTANGLTFKADKSVVDTIDDTVKQQGIDLKAAQGELKLKLTQSDLTKGLNGYATQTWAQNQITATANGINGTLSSVKSTVDSQTTSINDLKADSSSFKSQFTTVNDTIGKHTTDIGTLQASSRELTSGFNTLTTDNTTNKNDISQLKQTSKEVSSTLETVQTQVQNSAVGTNLLTNTSDFSYNWLVWSGQLSISKTMEYNGYPSMVFASSSDQQLAYQTLGLGKLENSFQYTSSFWAKADNVGDKAHTELWGSIGATDFVLTTNWVRYTTLLTSASDANTNSGHSNCYFGVPGGNKGNVYIALPKLEKGSLATDWCANPADNATVTAFSKLSQTVDGFSATFAKKTDLATTASNLKVTADGLNLLTTATGTNGEKVTQVIADVNNIKTTMTGANGYTTRLQTLEGFQNTATSNITNLKTQQTTLAGQYTSLIESTDNKVRTPWFDDGENGTWNNPSTEIVGGPDSNVQKLTGHSKYLKLFNRDNYEDGVGWFSVTPGEVYYFSGYMGSWGTNYAVSVGLRFETEVGDTSWISATGFSANSHAPMSAITGSITVPNGVVRAKTWVFINGPINTDLGYAAISGLRISKSASGSQITQLQDNIDLRVKVDNKVTAALSLSADGGGTVTIRGASLYVTAASHFDNASIKSAAIANLDAAKITSGSISSDRLVTTKLNANNITSGSIAAERIATTALSATNITSGTLDVGKLTVKNLSADMIASGTIDASKITVKNLSASNIIGGELDAGVVNVKNLSASKLTSGTIDASNINVVNLNASNITSGYINADRIGTHSLSVDKISDSSYSYDDTDIAQDGRKYSGSWSIDRNHILFQGHETGAYNGYFSTEYGGDVYKSRLYSDSATGNLISRVDINASQFQMSNNWAGPGSIIRPNGSFVFSNLRWNAAHSFTSFDGGDLYFNSTTDRNTVKLFAKDFVKSSKLSMKTDIKKLDEDLALSTLLKTDVELYKYNDDTVQQYAGLIIDDVNDTPMYNSPAPFVSTNREGVLESNLTAYLIQTIKQLNKRIETLEAAQTE